MPDIHDMTSDAYPSVSEVTKELAQAHCQEQRGHKNYEYVPEDQECGIVEHMFCLDCGEINARQVVHCSVPLHKSSSVVISRKEDLKYLNKP